MDSIAAVAAALTAGKPAVFPTDTVYGIGVAVGLAASPEALYRIKKRDANKAIPWLVGNKGALKLYGKDVCALAEQLADHFWPGPLTLIVNAADNVPAAFCGQDRTIALRMPNDATALEIIERVGFPVATSSANVQGAQPPQSFADVAPEILHGVAAACGDDVPRIGVASTIIDCTKENPRVVRQGAADVSAFLDAGL